MAALVSNNGGLGAENQTLEADTEAMHVDVTPSTSDREDEALNPSVRKTEEEDSFASTFKHISKEKLDQRAQRFGVEISPLRLVTDAEVKALYKSLEIDWRDASNEKTSKVRLNGIHMRGVEEMNTDDVFDYYKEQPPDSVEWVNDQSCNALWVDPLCAARAMLTYSQPIKRSPPSIHKEAVATEEVAIVSEPEEGEDIEMTEQESVLTPVRTRSQSGDSNSQKSHSRRDSGDPLRTPVPNNSPVDASQIEETSCSDIGNEIDSSTIEIPIPPGPWRLGVTSDRAKAVLMRFAFRSDRKIPGAEKLSQYYLKYGNPNYKGLKGIISTSLKRKMRKTDYVDLDAVKDDEFQEEGQMFDLADYARPKEHTKRPRMRMYADDEEEKGKRASASVTSTSLHPGDLRNRITFDKPSIPLTHASSDSRDLRSKLGSRPPPRSSHHSLSEDEGEYQGSRYSAVLDLSQPIMMGDLRSKLEKLRQSRQPRVPLLIEVSQDDALF